MQAFHDIRNPDTQVEVGDRTHIGSNVVLGPRCQRIRIGYGCFLGNDIYIDVDELEMGDYTTIHHGSVIHGLRTRIGHNCWIGHYTIIDSLGGDTRLGNNVGVGAHSQLWSHMKFGDTLEGCRWHSAGPLHLDDDVWLVGHSIVGPIHAHARAMLMTGSVATRDMEGNRIYAGTPARDVSDKFGHQFEQVATEEKVRRFEALRATFCEASNVSPEQFQLVERFSPDAPFTQFHIASRSYRPVRSEAEYRFIKFMLYDKAKWLPSLDAPSEG
jgi:acetyltransferase-like isoleucine patch superfamily enzyme